MISDVRFIWIGARAILANYKGDELQPAIYSLWLSYSSGPFHLIFGTDVDKRKLKKIFDYQTAASLKFQSWIMKQAEFREISKFLFQA